MVKKSNVATKNIKIKKKRHNRFVLNTASSILEDAVNGKRTWENDSGIRRILLPNPLETEKNPT